MPQQNRRQFLLSSSSAAAAITLAPVGFAARCFASSPNEEIGLGLIGAGGRGSGLAKGFARIAGTRLVAVADPDEKRSGKFQSAQCTAYTDLRKLLENPNVDAVIIATCNHWHCLAAIWAMQAGKDVYVEKPLSHSQWEGRQVVKAARTHGRIVQLGTQQRSDPMQAEIKRFLHEEKALGKIRYAQANRLGQRGPIGKRKKPLSIPPEVDYDLWLGPAQDQPIYRNQLHYDWHWDWNTGSGEMGNWGVHVLDDVRNVAYLDQVTTPRRILAIGGRVAWDDAGNTPNVHYVYFDTGTFPALIALSNLASAPGKRGGWTTKGQRPVAGPGTGYVIACEGGYYLGQRGSGRAIDRKGKTIRTFKCGAFDQIHKQNFIEAVRTREANSLNAEIEVGHHSSGWCNLANIAYRAGQAFSREAFTSQDPGVGPFRQLLEEMREQLERFDIPLSDPGIRLSPMLNHDPQTERFVGEHAELANSFVKREYRDGFVVPEDIA